MKSFFAPVFMTLIIAYFAYIMVTPVSCLRVERSTLPVRLTGDLIEAAARPWATEATVLRIRLYTLRGQLKMANFIQHQFNRLLITPSGRNKQIRLIHDDSTDK